MIAEVMLRNFKCFGELRLELAPLTLLCGVNGTGKSSLLQSLLVLRQSFLSGELKQGRLVLTGELADLGTGGDVLFDGAEEDMLAFELRGCDKEDHCRFTFDYEEGADQLQSTFPYTQAMGRWESRPPFSQMHYVAAERIGPRKVYGRSRTAANRSDLGPRGEHTINDLAAHGERLLGSDDPRAVDGDERQVIKIVNHWLQDVAPGTHLQFEEIPKADAILAGFSFARTGDVETRRYRTTNVGFGLSYVLPVVAALLAPARTLCLIENPEAHLHPRGQTRIAELAVRAAMAGVQVVVETHSDHVLDGVRIAVAEGLIPPKDTRFHYFEQQDGQAVVETPQIDDTGRLSEWPEGFFDQHALNLARLLAPKT